MNRRGALLLVALLPVAVGAALWYRPASGQRDLQGARYLHDYESVVERMPVLDAVRVYSTDPSAGHVIEIAHAPGIESVLDARRAREFYRYGQLLYASEAELAGALARLERGEVPEMPSRPGPGISLDGFACDVIVDDPSGLDRIRELVKEAELGGEPAALEREQREGRRLTQALLVAIAGAALVFAVKRETEPSLERRLAGALLPALALGALGWGIDAPTLAALVLAICAAEGAPLWVGALLIFFPAAALQRVGVVLLGAWLVRGPSKGLPSRRPQRAVLAGWLVLLVGAAFTIGPLAPAAAPEVTTGQAVRFGEAIDLHPLLPEPVTTLKRKTLMRKIYDRAELLARQSADPAPFEEVARAAAKTELHLPRALAGYLKSADGREAIWSQELPDPTDERWHSAELSRVRGDLALRRDARWAAALMLVLLALVRGATVHPKALAESLAIAAAVAGSVILVLGTARFGGNADLWLPLVVAAVAATPQRAYLPLIVAGAVFPEALGVPMAALVVVALLSRRSR